MRLSGNYDLHWNFGRRHDRRHVYDARRAGSSAAKRHLASNAQAVAPVAITHVSVIDVRSGEIRNDYTVVVTDRHISYAGPASSAPSTRRARIVDGKGKFLIPGLWDMHVRGFMYVFSDFAGPLMIANGVTGARDMGYHIDTTLRWKRDIAAGKEIGPRLVVGVRVDGPEGEARFIAHVKTAEDRARAVDTLARHKDRTTRADFIAIDRDVPRDAYFGIAREAKRVGVAFAGAVPSSVSIVEAADSGQHSIEREDDLMHACPGLRASGCRNVMAALARNQTWVTPTLVSYQPYAHGFDSGSTHPELAKYVPGLVKGGWARRAANKSDSMTVRNYFSFQRTRELKESGVKLLAGTDMPQAFVYPGFSLHDELALLVKSGLTPLEALQTATINPAEFLGMQGSVGTIEKGKVADLVLLDANPLDDIANTRKIRVVITNGRLFDRLALTKLLQHVDSALKR